MYKVFVNDRPMYVTNKAEDVVGKSWYVLDKKNVQHVIDELNSGNLADAFLYYEGEESVITILKGFLPLEIAGGGLVKNAKNKVLFIKRNGRWDLPKGKVDKGESWEAAALREVEEETGVTDLVMQGFLMTTYHILERKGIKKLKIVHWYKMETNYDAVLVPQAEEGITKVRWKGPKKTLKALKNTYANIELLFTI